MNNLKNIIEILSVHKPIFSARDISLFNTDGSIYEKIDLVIFNGQLYHVGEEEDRLKSQRVFIRDRGYKGILHSIIYTRNDFRELTPKSYYLMKDGKIKDGI